MIVGLIGLQTDMKMIKAKTMIELRQKIYKCENWTRLSGESYASKIKLHYDVIMDQKNNLWIGVKK